MGILSWILIGLIGGALGKLLVPGRERGGILMTLVLGVVGALVGGWISTLLGFGGLSGFDLRSVIIAALGAALLVVVIRAIRK